MGRLTLCLFSLFRNLIGVGPNIVPIKLMKAPISIGTTGTDGLALIISQSDATISTLYE
jgi:hypothetical protein